MWLQGGTVPLPMPESGHGDDTKKSGEEEEEGEEEGGVEWEGEGAVEGGENVLELLFNTLRGMIPDALTTLYDASSDELQVIIKQIAF